MNEQTNKYRTVAYKVLIHEAVLAGVVVLLLLPGVGFGVAASVAIGSLAFIVPNAYFTKYVFRHSAADSARLAVRGFYIGEVLKLVATVLVFSLGFLLVDGLNVAVLIFTYLVLLVLNLIGNSILVDR